MEGTTLYDGIVKSARSFVGETNSGRVVIVVTDGNETRSTATLESAIHAREAGVLVYVVAIESRQFNPAPLRRLARDTGGSYRGAGSSGQLRSVYAGIAAELRRTWRVEYLTSARGGDALKLDTSVPKLGAASARLTIPGEAGVAVGAVQAPAGDGVRELPHQVVGALVGLLALLADLRAHLGPRLSPQEATRAAHRADGDEAEAGASAAPGRRRPLPGNRAHVWPLAALGRPRPTARTQRRPAPHRGVRLSQLRNGPGLRAGGGILAQGTLMILAAMAARRRRPWLVVYIKGKRRTAAFENQLPDLLITLARR